MRHTIILATLTIPVLTIALGPTAGEERTSRRPVVCDAPLAAVHADRLPLKKPESWEVRDDHQLRPYHLLVRLVKWPGFEPYPIDDLTRLVIAGHDGPGRPVGPGEYSFADLSNGGTFVTLYESAPAAISPPALPTRPTVIAARNPVPLARFSVTECELVVLGEGALERSIIARGNVFDRLTGETIEGAILRTASGSELSTDLDGYFEADQPLSFGDFLSGLVVHKDGYEPLFVQTKMLSATWLRTYEEQQALVYTLLPETDPEAVAPVLHPRGTRR